MRTLAFIAGVALIILVLVDGFESVVLPRRVMRPYRLARLFIRSVWWLWTGMVRVLPGERRRENYLSFFGPLSLPLLLGFWAMVLLTGFALLYWAPGNAVKTPDGIVGIGTCLYLSGTTFFTLGIGDFVPLTSYAKTLIVLESGMGFAFLAVAISFLPALGQSISRREVTILLLDARAGSPPTAAEILRRHAQDSGMEALTRLLREWELWSAEVLESHLSFPVLVYFRSQHDNQSWLAALTAILDTCAFIIANGEGVNVRQARLTFAMARHAIVDLALVLHARPREPGTDRLPLRDLAFMRSKLVSGGMDLQEDVDAAGRLNELRRMYDPFVYALSIRLRLSVPPWILETTRRDNWQTDGPEKRAGHRDESHF
jgi:hypothetical protein